ncbi:MAG: thioesterase [Microscillaceae bacterium]|jgi:acyl-ACP thioesterase|nr:thioesterase [Microscillaceae bacterium]
MAYLLTNADYSVRLDEVDSRHRLTVVAMLGYLQEIAWQASVEGKVPIPTLIAQGFTWVLSRFQLEMLSYPHYTDHLTIETYAPLAEKFYLQRDFVVRHQGQVVALAASNWVVVELAKKKLAVVPEFVKTALHNPQKMPYAMNKNKIADLQQADYQHFTTVKWHDLDINEHTNNKHYFRWSLDALPPEIWTHQKLTKLDMQFRAESFWGDNLQINAQKMPDNTFLHQIIDKDSQKGVVRGLSEWAKMDS